MPDTNSFQLPQEFLIVGATVGYSIMLPRVFHLLNKGIKEKNRGDGLVSF